MQKLTLSDVNLLLRGASILACGGGLPFGDQKTLLKKPALRAALLRGISLREPSELENDEVFATVSEIGAADAPVMDKTLLPKALDLLEQKTGKRVAGLIPGEIGQEAITLEAAALLGLPVVNSDLSGCRAVPRLSDLALVVQGIPFTMSPMVVLNSAGEMQFIEQAPSLSVDERTVRKLVPEGEVVTMLGGLITGKVIKEFLDYRSYSVASRVAQSLVDREELAATFPTPLVVQPVNCTVMSVQEVSRAGFNEKEITFTSPEGEGKILVENEYMKLQLGGKEFSFPQLIMLIDPQKNRGLHSSEIQIEMEVVLVVADAFPFWKGKGKSI